MSTAAIEPEQHTTVRLRARERGHTQQAKPEYKNQHTARENRQQKGQGADWQNARPESRRAKR
jgi:hypothetical protein